MNFFVLSSLVIVLYIENSEGIIGYAAKVANKGQFPYHVSLQWYGNDGCSGSIIGERFVVSAAHCMIQLQGARIKWTRQIKILPGVVDLNHTSNEREYWTKLHDIEKIYIPLKTFRSFDDFYKNDIVVIKLEKPFDFANSDLKPLSLPAEKSTYEDETAVVTGYGWNYLTNKTRFNAEINADEEVGKSLDKLHYAKVKIFKHDNGYCKDEEIMCAQVVQNNNPRPSGVCGRDSGGPLVYNNNVLIGLVSRSPRHCDESVLPAYYTDVSFHKSFIEKSMNDTPDPEIVAIEYSKLGFFSRLEGNKVIY